jgi:F0F1-type ATP synthase epsilon subunit
MKFFIFNEKKISFKGKTFFIIIPGHKKTIQILNNHISFFFFLKKGKIKFFLKKKILFFSIKNGLLKINKNKIIIFLF